MTDLALLLALGIGTLFVSQLISQWLPAVPYVLTLTTIALVLAQLPAVHRLRGATVLGYFTVLLFLAVVGAYCDLVALIANGAVAGILLAWVTIIVGVHAFVIFGIGGLFRQDWAIIAVASNANVGGATSAGCIGDRDWARGLAAAGHPRWFVRQRDRDLRRVPGRRLVALSYSALRAIIGSTRVARWAGSQQASSVTDPRRSVTTAKVIGSTALTP